MELRQFRDLLFARGARLGFAEMEIYYQSRERFGSRMFKGELENFTVAVDGGLAFRALYGGRMGYAYTERLDESSIDLLLAGAKESAEITDGTDPAPLFAGSPAYPRAAAYDEALDRVTAAEKIAFLRALEEECHRASERVTGLQYCMLHTIRGEEWIANTRGLEKQERRNGAYIIVAPMVRQGDEVKSSFLFRATRNLAALDPADLAREAVAESLSFLGAEPVESGSYPVILRHTAAASLLATFAPAFSAERAQKGLSRLKGKVGQRVAGENITVMDDPLMPDGGETRSFDSEGVASRRLAVIENGVLTTLLHNLKSARIDGAEPTGHGYRSSYKGAVGIAPSNLFIQPGTATLQDLIGSMAEGIVIAEIQGAHAGANPISGDFSLAAHGYYVQGGKIRRPVNQITVAGNFFDLLRQIEAIASDLQFTFLYTGYIGSPSLKVKSLSIGGK